MKKFAQFILEKLDSEIKTEDIVIDKIGHDDLTAQELYDSTPSTGKQKPQHPIISAIEQLKTKGGNVDLVFRINHDGTTHTIRIPPVEGNFAKGRVDFTHEITKRDETTREHHELKLSSTPKTAVGKTGKLADLIGKFQLPASTTLRQKMPLNMASRILVYLKRNILKGMPKINDKDKRFLTISREKDHGLLHPDPAIHNQILSEIKELPKNKQKLVHQALRLMYERITSHTKPDENIESEFHSIDLDDREQAREIGSHLSGRMSYLGRNNVRYISVKTNNGDDHAIIRVDPKDVPHLQKHLQNGDPLEPSHPLHGNYMGKIITTGRYKTTIAPSHEEASSIIRLIGRNKIETNTRVLPQ